MQFVCNTLMNVLLECVTISMLCSSDPITINPNPAGGWTGGDEGMGSSESTNL